MNGSNTNKPTDCRFAYLMLLPVALIVVVVTGCSSIPTANIHPARPVDKKQFGLQCDYLLAYNPVSMVEEHDYDEFMDMRMPCISISGRYGIANNTELDLMVYVLPVGFETYAKRCVERGNHHWLSLELGGGCNIQTKDSNVGGALVAFLFFPWLDEGYDFESINYYYNNYYFFTGALYEYHFPFGLGFNTRLSVYCANVNIKAVTEEESANYFHRLFFPQLGLSIISPEWGGRLALNFDVIYFENPVDDEWYPGYNFGISGYGPLPLKNLLR